jgi:hypothetical protein
LQPDTAHWLTDDWSDTRPIPAPEKFERYGNHFQAVWYSDPHDRDGSMFAGMVEISPTEVIVTEYAHSSEYDYDVPDEDREPPHWKMQSVEFDTGWLYKTIIMQMRRAEKAAQTAGTPAGRVRPPRDPKVIAGWAKTIGGAYIGYHGGDEDIADSLP